MNNAGHNPEVKKPEYLTYIPTTRRYNAFHKAMDKDGTWGFKHITAGCGYWNDINKFNICLSIEPYATDNKLKEIETEIKALEPWHSKIMLFRNDPDINNGTFHLEFKLPTDLMGENRVWHLIKAYYGTFSIEYVDHNLMELLKKIRENYYYIEDKE